ncbi:MAG TPA: LysM peptidoglycan-binding domain-containing protein [Wenzhouxiangellaceae bacterium]|nr:LysM peptidoglycan-binding domain-containing protein [Wenzhouxiangellaceae bacterium]
MPESKLHATACAAAILLAAGGCAVNQKQSEPVAQVQPRAQQALEPSPSDPFAAVDRAFERLAMDRSAPSSDNIGATPLIWPRLIDRFSISSCPDGSTAARWANWYADNSDYMQRVLVRAQPWMHLIVGEIERRDLPGELALLPVVESAFDPFAYSHGRAAGPWQFLSGTARDFGITINEWYDGRRDFVAATGAALDYLKYLSDLFDGDWALALAAYNAGQGRVGRAIRRNAARGLGTEWHELPLPRETLGYVPKLQGLGCLFRDPVRYAFVLPSVLDAPQVATVDLEGPVDVVALAMRTGLDLTELITLNAGLNRHMTPPTGPAYLVVPVAEADRVTAALRDLPEPPPLQYQQIRIQRGDSLSVLARRHGTTIDALKQANNLSGNRLIAGQALRLPGKVVETAPGGDADYQRVYREMAALQQQLLPTDRFIHRVRSGESLWVIARRYGISVGDLQRMNGLGPRTLIRPGQRLVIETDRAVRSPAVSNQRYVVRQGDSLWLISRRQRVGLNELMRWNDLDPDSVLRPGQELIIRRGGDA